MGAQARPGFVFAVKLGAFGSHRMKFRDPASWMAKHLDRVRRLDEHLGPNLVQLPPRWRRNVERLDEFLSDGATNDPVGRRAAGAIVVARRRVQVLRRHNAALCIHDLLEPHPFELTADWTYVRFHGPDAIEHPYHGSYGEAQLGRWADRLGPVLDDGRDVFAYFNNDWYGHAVTDAAFLRDQLTTRLSTRN